MNKIEVKSRWSKTIVFLNKWQEQPLSDWNVTRSIDVPDEMWRVFKEKLQQHGYIKTFGDHFLVIDEIPKGLSVYGLLNQFTKS